MSRDGGHHGELGRLRWHCRRGLLELDLVFARFLKKHFDSMDAEQLAALEELLGYEDADLWDMVSGRKPCTEPRLKGMVDLLRET